MGKLYDLQTLAEKAGLSPDQYQRLERCVREQHGSDEMMVELRLLRTLRAVRDGVVSIDDAIAEFGGRSTPLRGAG